MAYVEKDFLDTIFTNRLASPPDVHPTEVSGFLLKALQTYSVFKPRILAAEMTGDGSKYDFDLPTDWVEGFSQIIDIEYPSGSQIPTYLKAYQYRIYQSATTKKLRLLTYIPGATEKLLVTYTLPHSVTSAVNTTEQQDFSAICDLAASVGCDYLAEKFAQTQSSTLDADVVNYLSKVDYYRNLSRRLMVDFKTHFGMKEDDVVPAISKVGDMPAPTSTGGLNMLLHPRL